MTKFERKGLEAGSHHHRPRPTPAADADWETAAMTDQPPPTNPGLSNPSRSNPGRSNPGRSNPGRGEPGPQQPGPQQPGQQQPGPQNPPWPQQPWPAGLRPPPPIHPQATTVLVLGIVAVVVCQVVGPFAWTMGNRVVAEIDAAGGRVGGRTEATVGRILGIVATALLGLSVVVFGLFMMFNVAMVPGSPGSRGSPASTVPDRGAWRGGSAHQRRQHGGDALLGSTRDRLGQAVGGEQRHRAGVTEAQVDDTRRRRRRSAGRPTPTRRGGDARAGRTRTAAAAASGDARSGARAGRLDVAWSGPRPGVSSRWSRARSRSRRAALTAARKSHGVVPGGGGGATYSDTGCASIAPSRSRDAASSVGQPAEVLPDGQGRARPAACRGRPARAHAASAGGIGGGGGRASRTRSRTT